MIRCVGCGAGASQWDWCVKDRGLIDRARKVGVALKLDGGNYLHERCQKKLRLLVQFKREGEAHGSRRE